MQFVTATTSVSRPSSLRSLRRAAVAAVFALPATAAATSSSGAPAGHADRSHYVTFVERDGWQYRINTSSCRIAVKDMQARRARNAKVKDLRTGLRPGTLRCKSDAPDCISYHAHPDATSGSTPLGGFDWEAETDWESALQCAPWLLPGNDFYTWHWSGSNANSINLSPSSKRRFATRDSKRGVLLDANGSRIQWGPWQADERVGICRVRYLGADYFGTIIDVADARIKSPQRTYRWSSSAHKYVTTENVGSGTKCRVAFSTSSKGGAADVATFRHFDTLEREGSMRWSNYNPGATVPSDAAVLGMRRNAAVYMCRIRYEWRTAKNLTQGTQFRSRDYDFGYYVEGSNECVTPMSPPASIDSRRVQILRNPI